MGYDVHITRKENWFDEGGPIITEDEWRDYVASDPEMKITGVAEHTNPQGETIRLTSPLLTEWRKRSSGSIVWLSYHEGNLALKNPDDECLAKLRQIASKLKARVQGDDGEFYDGTGETPQQTDSSLRDRIAGWFRHLRSAKPLEIQHEPLPFAVGDRVRDPWGNQHTVIGIDPKAEHGLGMIRTRRDDGTEIGHAMVAHGLAPIIKTKQ
jgi:hypothetical protein